MIRRVGSAETLFYSTVSSPAKLLAATIWSDESDRGLQHQK
jgi:hypothetical protein